MHPFHTYPSTYLACLIWGAAGFMGQPTMAAFLVHFVIVPILLLLVLWLAHWEGRYKSKQN
jgi:hypothetical protein